MSTRDIGRKIKEEKFKGEGKRYGLVIGIDEYQDDSLSNLKCAKNDAQAMYDLMIDPECGLFDPKDVTLLINEKATRVSVLKAFKYYFSNSKKEDTFWLYYAGHAAPEGDDYYWILNDSEFDNLDATGISQDDLLKRINKVECDRKVILLDCCYAEAMSRISDARSTLDVKQLLDKYTGVGCVTLMSSNRSQKSVEVEEKEHGAFTYYLIEGLRGKADKNNSGVVTIDELWDYLNKKVSDDARQKGFKQTPKRKGDDVSHNFPLTINKEQLKKFKEQDEYNQKISTKLQRLCGWEENMFSREEVKICIRVLQNGAETKPENELVEALEDVINDNFHIKYIKLLINNILNKNEIIDGKQDIDIKKTTMISQEVNIKVSHSESKKQADSVMFEFDLSTGTVKKCNKDIKLKELVVPSEINGVKVKRIGEKAFWFCTSLTNVIIPNSVISIGNKSFYYCRSLTSITIPESVVSIGDDAFGDCKSLKCINVSPKNKHYKSIDGVLFNSSETELLRYPIKKEGRIYKIPNNVKIISNNAFCDCKYLINIEMSKSLTIIGENAFSCCKLKHIVIPENLTSININAFSFIWSLKSIQVSQMNKNYKSIDGVLFNFSGTEILKYPRKKKGKIYTIPNKVTKIGESAFAACKLWHIEIPNSITSIGDWAFCFCNSLLNVQIPNSVINIGNHAFAWCKFLRSVKIPNSVESIDEEAFALCGFLRIYCEENSKAREYAINNGIKYRQI